MAHGISVTHMIDLFDLEGSTIRKYVDIVCDALCDKNKLFNNYISIPFGQHLQKIIINRFHDLTVLPNICGAIDGTHIPFTSFSNKRVQQVIFLIGKDFIALWCKQFVMQTKKFGMSMLANLVKSPWWWAIQDVYYLYITQESWEFTRANGGC